MNSLGADGSAPSGTAKNEGAASSRDLDPRTVVEEYLYLLDDASHIDHRPAAAHATTGELLDVISNAHALAILDHLCCEKRPLRFSELEDVLGVSPKVLSRRLKELAEAGLVSRRSYDEMPPRVEYESTTKTEELGPAFQFLYAWGERYASDPRSTERVTG